MEKSNSSESGVVVEAEEMLLRRPKRIAILKRNPRLRKYLIRIALFIVGISLLLFLITFVAIPLAFKYSIDFQRFIIFMPVWINPSQFEYFQYNIKGARNFYVNVETSESIRLGALHLLPTALVNDSIPNDKYNYTQALAQADYPILMHFHGNAGNRFYNLDSYLKLREYFHVIGFDYQCYGDSTNANLTEADLVMVALELYKWILAQSPHNNIYVWGHSMGGAIAARTIAELASHDIVPKGLVLEATFPSLMEEVEYYSLAKPFTWLPWFKFTIIDGLTNNGFVFNTSCYLKHVKCPIMILHAEDDALIPCTLADKLNTTAVMTRNNSTQGGVIFHRISAAYHCNHWSIVQCPEFSNYVKEYLSDCEDYNEKKENATYPSVASPRAYI